MKRTILILVICLPCLIVFAGVITVYQCSNNKCDFKGESFRGAGKATTNINGYCVECKKLATISYKNNEKTSPVAIAWDSVSGNTIELYECPDCKKPFAKITKMAYCPKCGQGSITESMDGKWD